MVGLAIVVWAVPLQFVGWYDNGGITDIPTYREAYDHIASGEVPYLDFSLEYPPLAAGLFWLAGVLPGQYEVGFSILMLICLCATALGVLALARTLGLDQRRQALAAGAVAVSPLLLGNLVETRFDLALAALLAWTLWAAASGRFRLAWGLLAGGHAAEADPAGAGPRAADLAAPPRGRPRRLGRPGLVRPAGGRRDRAVRGRRAVRHLGHRPRTTSTARSRSSPPAARTCSACTPWPTCR